MQTRCYPFTCNNVTQTWTSSGFDGCTPYSCPVALSNVLTSHQSPTGSFIRCLSRFSIRYPQAENESDFCSWCNSCDFCYTNAAVC